MNEMEKIVKIAVIVPVYNGGKFLPEFLSCLNGQTMKDFEAYFVDDGSTDDTASLLQEAVLRNMAFHYMRNEKRRGAAFSRNRGIACSRSSYVLCLDADDLIADDLLEQLAEAAEEYHADMVMLERGDFKGSASMGSALMGSISVGSTAKGSIFVGTRSGVDNSASSNLTGSRFVRRENIFGQDDKALFEKLPFQIVEQPQDFLLRCQNGTCDRMVARSLIDKYQIRFQDLPSSNDVYYALFSIFAARRIAHTRTSDFLYYRRLHSEPDRISNDRDPLCAFEALLAVKEALLQHHMWEENCVHFWIFALDSLEKQLFVCKRQERQEQVYRYLQREGLGKLGVPGDVCFARLPEAYRKQFARFLTLPYEEKCFLASMTFHALCESSKDKMATLFAYAIRFREKGLRIGYWGAGRMTEGFIAAALNSGENVDYLIDNSTAKQGKRICGLEVTAYDKVWEQTGLVIVSNKQYFSEIVEQVKACREETKVICIQEYLYGTCSLEECIR